MRSALLTAALCLASMGAQAAQDTTPIKASLTNPAPTPAPLSTTSFTPAAAPASPSAPAPAAETAVVPLPPMKKREYDPDNTVEYTHEEMCESLVTAARERDLPVAFFARLIWHESQFKPNAISPVGAIGIAQFMPAVARAMDIENPFDAREALPASAELLDVLKQRFGNIGLAAAAYNSTPNRVSNWLKNKATLPDETKKYVIKITGRPAESWRGAKSAGVLPQPPRYVPCMRVDTFVKAERAERVEAERVEAVRVAAERAEAERIRVAAAAEKAARKAKRGAKPVQVAAAPARKAEALSSQKRKPQARAEAGGKPAGNQPLRIADNKPAKPGKSAAADKARPPAGKPPKVKVANR
jgi:hypothetical protein